MLYCMQGNEFIFCASKMFFFSIRDAVQNIDNDLIAKKERKKIQYEYSKF